MANFHYVAVLLDMLYGLELDNEDLEEIALQGWNMIGNKNARLYKCSLQIDPTDNSVTLPCNILGNGLAENSDCIEAVTAAYEDWSNVTNYSHNGDNRTFWIENSNEALKYHQSPYYMSGKFLKYHQVGDKLYFEHNYGIVNILYKGVLADEEGLPELSEKEARALATFVAYIIKFREGLATMNQAITQQAEMLHQMWLKQCDQARVSYLNQNAMNNIIEIKGSWDRASYSKSYKPIR